MDSFEKVRQSIDAMGSGIRTETVNEFQKTLQDLETRKHSPMASVVKMMQSIGKYLASRTDQVHPDTLGVLEELAGKLEVMIRKPDPDRDRQALGQAMNAFKKLKGAIADGALVTEREMEEVKAVILSIDWEISDITLTGFNSTVHPLMERLKSNKLHFSFLKIMQSIVGYVAKNKANSHKDSIGLLRRVFSDYERMVRTPGLSPLEKKALAEASIQAFGEFKRKLSRTLVSDAESWDQGVVPALSHIKTAVSTGTAAPLSELSDQAISLLAEEEKDSSLVLPHGKDLEKGPQDVMGDLFSPKESPADELLDAIHLADIHGPGQENAMNMFGTGQQEGIKIFTPQKSGKAPISEIEARLDAFFNQEGSAIPEEEDVKDLEDADLEPGGTLEETGTPAGLETLAFDSVPEDGESVVPFTYEDELFREEEETGDEAGMILDRLRSGLSFPAELTREASHEAVVRDISRLADLWQKDPDKCSLLEIVAGLARHIHNCGKEDFSEPENQSRAEELSDPPAEAKTLRPRGLWGRIKAMFGK